LKDPTKENKKGRSNEPFDEVVVNYLLDIIHSP